MHLARFFSLFLENFQLIDNISTFQAQLKYSHVKTFVCYKMSILNDIVYEQISLSLSER